MPPTPQPSKEGLPTLTPTPTPIPPTHTPARTATLILPTPSSPLGDIITLTPQLSITVVFVTVKGAPPEGEASVTVKTAPNAACTVAYVTPSGTGSTARGLEPKRADGNGEASWTWTIGSSTRRGQGSVTVTCNGAKVTTRITIG
jgi:hypothetical protein